MFLKNSEGQVTKEYTSLQNQNFSTAAVYKFTLKYLHVLVFFIFSFNCLLLLFLHKTNHNPETVGFIDYI